MDNLYLTLPSNTKDFPTNTPADFRVRLPYPLDLDGDWELGLVEIQYPFSWDNVKGGTEKSNQDNWILIDMQPNNAYYEGMIELRIPTGSYASVESLITAMQDTMDNWRPERKTKKKKIRLSRLVMLSYDKTYSRVRIKLDTTAIKGVVLGTPLQYMLGFGGKWSYTFSKAQVFGTYPPDLTSGFNTLYVYCDLIQPQIVGNILAPLLRTVAVSGEFGKTVDKIFLEPHYLPLRNKRFDTVQLSIKSDQNESVKFNFGKSIIKLHLRRKR